MINDGVMLAFLPSNSEWCRQPNPHVTLVYCGTTEDVSYGAFGDLAKDAISVCRLIRRPFVLDVIGVDQFGGNDGDPVVDVLKLKATAEVEVARRYVERWNKSSHPFDVHATIGPEGSAEGELPTRLYFDRILAAWGSKQLIFRLGEF